MLILNMLWGSTMALTRWRRRKSSGVKPVRYSLSPAPGQEARTDPAGRPWRHRLMQAGLRGGGRRSVVIRECGAGVEGEQTISPSGDALLVLRRESAAEMAQFHEIRAGARRPDMVQKCIHRLASPPAGPPAPTSPSRCG